MFSTSIRMKNKSLTENRIDFLVMPLLILGFFALQLDRGNMYAEYGPFDG